MFRNERISTFLLICLLGCLFIFSVNSPKRWRDLARRTTVDDLLAQLADGPGADGSVSLPFAPNCNRSSSPWDVWTVAEASAPFAAWPIVAGDEGGKPGPVPLTLKLVGEAEDTADALDEEESAEPLDLEFVRLPDENPAPRVAFIPDPSRPSLDLPRELPGEERMEEPSEEAVRPDWPLPVALFEQLDELAGSAATRSWAIATRSLTESLIVALSSQADREAGHKAAEIFDRLRVQNRLADRLAAGLRDDYAAEMVRRCAYSLRRRLDLWRLISVIEPPESAAANAESPTDGSPDEDTTQLAMVLKKIDALMGNSAEAAAWREFLLIEALKGLADGQKESSGNEAEIETGRASEQSASARRRAVAGEVLARVARSKLSENQRQFLMQESFMALGTQLRQISDASFDRCELVRLLEQYESSNLPSDARRVVDESLRLAVSRDQRQRVLGEQLAVHYCNPNIRMALTQDFLNRLMPEQTAELQPVRDTVLGNPVRGRSLTETEVSIRLIPDPHRLLLALEISGDVASITNSKSGPATFHSASFSKYVARKPMELTTAGIALQPAEVTRVENQNQLRSVNTDYDWIPLIGSLAQGVARSSHDSKRQEVRYEIKRKVATRAKQRIDAEADSRLGETSQRLKARLLQPLANLEIEPEVIGAETTEQRLVMQLRLASDKQLAAHTLRPWAPSDSLLSLQVHETAVNNVLGGLKLEGAAFTLAELKKHVADKLNRPVLLDGDGNHDDAIITFAQRDAARVECRDGRIAVTLSIARLETEPRVWNDFQVRAYYRVRLDGLSAELERDGSVRMVGRRVSTSSQLAIRSIFIRVFSKNASLQLLPESIRDNPNMSDQEVTQFEIEDGWVAMALGPRR